MKKIFFITGELSGETHTKNLINYLKQLRKDIKYYAVGSDLLKKEGCKIIEDYRNISIIGFAEVISKYFYILKVFRKVKKFLKTEKPDLVILVDFPGFNLKIARYCKKNKIKTVYFIPPQIWAWHYKRIKKIKEYIELVIPILPYEEKIYQREGIPVKYYGHPIVENIKIDCPEHIYRKRLKISDKCKIIALFPGSRAQEIEYNMGIILKAALLIEKEIPDTYFLIGCAPTIDKKLIENNMKKHQIKNIKFLFNQTYNILNIADCVIAVSGTITLESAYFKVPMVAIYNISKISYWLIKNFIIKVKFISLVNLIAGKKVVAELVGSALTPENIANECKKLLVNKEYRKKQIKELSRIKKLIGNRGGLKKTASLISKFL